ncbi:MAG: 50S ribosomal protein L35 [Bdellovibrionales bacterium]|nr:50S ribosomal protein L35 [Bdellovibrionales bacterium]
MPKIKTRKGVSKRFAKTKTGKVKAKRANLRHILTSKPQKRKRQLRKDLFLNKTDAKKVREMMPY